MIFDKLENIQKYKFDLQFVRDSLSTTPFSKGKLEIEGVSKFAIDLEYSTKEAIDAIWEAHRRYLDIHVILEGEELIHISDIKNMSASADYQDDYQLFVGNTEQTIHLKQGYFLVLFQNEVHKTSVAVNGPSFVRKRVFKLID